MVNSTRLSKAAKALMAGVSVPLLALALAGCSGHTADPQPGAEGAGAEVAATGRRIIAADAEPQNWLAHGRNYQETRFSPLDEIDAGNVSKLGLAWFHDLDTNRGQEATPLVVDGIIYTTSAWSKVQALDGETGKLLWQFDPEVPGETAVKACCDVVNRGAAYWEGKLFVGTLDGRLIAIDAKTGKQLWSTVTVDQSKNYTITGAPRVVKGRVIIGNGGAEFGVRGYVSAYDAETGQMDWRFYTVPGEPGKPDGAASDAIMAKLGAATWSPDSWKLSNGGGGGTVWDSMAYDPELNLLYIGVGNSSYWPNRFRSPASADGRSNDNLFVASILALRPETGEYVWHYQQTPGDQWDYTSTQHMILTDLSIDGQKRKVLMQAPKNGFFYVIDRETGKLISAEPYATVTWAKGIDMKTGRPIINPAADYDKSGKPWTARPGTEGAHNWPPMSFSPRTGLVYIPTQERSSTFIVDPDFKPLAKGYNIGLDVAATLPPTDRKVVDGARKSMKGYLTAWDPVNQRLAWQVPQEAHANGGILSTAGDLLFQGGAPGLFWAYDARTGKRLWSFDAQSGVLASPVTWSKKGRQYVTVMSGWGTNEAMGAGPMGWSDKGPRRNISRVLTFALNGKAKLPPVPELPKAELQQVKQFADAATIEQGRVLFHRSCFGCHGVLAISGGVIPDLRHSPTIGDPAMWSAIVADGALSANGMVGFKDNYSAKQIESIRAYVIAQANNSSGFEP